MKIGRQKDMCSDTITHWEGFRNGYGWSEGGEWGLAKGCSVDVKEADGPEGGWSSQVKESSK